MRGGKLFIVAVAAMMCSVVSTAAAVELTLGPRISLGYASFYGDDYSDYLDDSDADRSFQLGVQAGAFLEVALSENFAIQPELAFVRGGGQESGTDPTVGDYDLTEKFNYIGVPILFKGMFPSGNGRIIVFGGPQFKFQVGDASVEVEAGGGSIEADYDDAAVRPVVVSGLVGAGYDFPAGPGRLSLEARGDIDFMSIFDPDETNDFNQRGFAVLLGIGYGFEL